MGGRLVYDLAASLILAPAFIAYEDGIRSDTETGRYPGTQLQPKLNLFVKRT